MRFCSSCGTQAALNVRFCVRCGAAFASPQPPPMPCVSKPVPAGKKRRLWVGLAVMGILGLAGVALSGLYSSVDERAVEKARVFLSSERRGPEILFPVHMLASYRSHEYVKMVPRGDGKFTLVYRFTWDEDGITNIGFDCNAVGNLEKISILNDNGGVFGIPFFAANTSIRVVGNGFIALVGNNLTVEDRQQAQRLVNQADAHGLLEMQLKIEQAVGM